MLSTFLFERFNQLGNIRDRVLTWIIERRTTILKIVIILAVLSGSMIMAFGIGRFSYIFAGLAILPIVFLAVEYLLQHFESFPIIILISAAFIPFSLPTGTESRLVISLVATAGFFGIWLMNMITIKKRISLEPSPLNLPILAFMAVTLISLLWSNIFRDALVLTWGSFPFVQAASAFVMIMLPTALLIVSNHIKTKQTLKILIGIMIVAGVIGIPRQYLGIRALPVNTGGLFNMWVILFSAALGLFHEGLTKLQRGLLLALAGIWIFWGAGLNISWIAGWLPGLFGLGIVVWMRSKKLVLLMCIVGIVIVLLNFTSVSNYVSRVIEAETQESGHTRLAAWEVNWRVTKEHWLFGTGPAGYAAYYMSYFPLEGTATHNNYIDILAQVGLVGLSLVLWIFFGLAWIGYKLIMRLRGRRDFFEAAANAALAGTMGCILMMAFGDWLFPFAYTQSIAGFDHAVYSWLFMGTILTIDRLTSQPETATTP